MGGVNETGSTVSWRNEKERGSEACGMQVTGRKAKAYGSEGKSCTKRDVGGMG